MPDSFILARWIGLIFSFAIGWLLANRKGPYWLIGGIYVMGYSLLEGLRYNRGFDYNHYKSIYLFTSNIDEYIDSTTLEPLFKALNSLFFHCGAPFFVVCIFYSVILSAGVIMMMRNHTSLAMFALPSFFMYTIVQSENLIRQYTAYGLFLIALGFLSKSRYYLASFWALCAIGFHSSILFLLPFVIAGFFLSPTMRVYRYFIIAIAIVAATWSASMIDSPVAQAILNNPISATQFSRYTENSERWFSSGSANDFGSTTRWLVRAAIMNCLLVWLSLRTTKHSLLSQISLFLFCVGAVTLPICYNIEILFRTNLMFLTPGFVLIGFSWAYRDSSSLLRRSLIVLVFLNLCYTSLNIDYTKPANQRLFVWDDPVRGFN